MTEKHPVIYLELTEKRNSGFVKQGTEGTSFHEELNCPNISWIPNSGFRAVEEDHNGVKTTVFKEVRWIKNCPTIDKEDQERRNIKPNPFEDKIPFEKGFATVVRNGSTISLYDYLTDVFFNENSIGRPETADAIYKIMQLDKQAEEIDESDIVMADAIKLVASLRIQTSAKDKTYKYNEERLTAICELCAVYADSIPTKFHALMSLAKARSKWFMDLVEKFEQTIVTETTHAVELKVVRFDGNTVLYTDGEKVIKNLGTGNLSLDTKIERLADFLKTKEGNEHLTELRAKMAVAKDNLKNV
jgi:hypothetical protein